MANASASITGRRLLLLWAWILAVTSATNQSPQLPSELLSTTTTTTAQLLLSVARRRAGSACRLVWDTPSTVYRPVDLGNSWKNCWEPPRVCKMFIWVHIPASDTVYVCLYIFSLCCDLSFLLLFWVSFEFICLIYGDLVFVCCTLVRGEPVYSLH